MSITVRDAHEGDIEFLARLNRVVQELHVAALPAYFMDPEPGTVTELFRTRLRDEGVRIWIASLDETAVGYAVAVTRERPENVFSPARRIFELEEIGVSPDRRRRGVARALLDHVLADAQSRGIRDVELTSWSFNTDAHRAFEALGFHPKLVRFGRESD